jgi:S1-C subfamily serine protease
MSVRSAWFMNRAKFAASLVGSGSGSVVTAGDKIGGCAVNTEGADDAEAVTGVVFAAGVDVVAFFADFFLLEGAGIVFAGWNAW